MYSTPPTMHKMIKRTLLLCVLSILAIAGRLQAQITYQMTVNYSIHGSGHKSECSSRYEIWAIMEDNSEWKVTSEMIDNLEDWDQWGFEPKTLTFQSNNKVKRLKIYSLRRRDEKIGGCDTKGQGTVYTDDFTYPCFHAYYTGTGSSKFPGYGDESTLEVTVKPVSNAYDLRIETGWVHKSTSITGFNYSVTAIYTDGSFEEISQLYFAGGLPNNANDYDAMDAIHIDSRKQIQTLRVYSSGLVVKGFSVAFQERTFDIPIYNDPANNYNTTISDPFIDAMDDNSYVKVSYNQVMNPIYYDRTPPSNILSVSDYVSLRGPFELPASEYIWKYQVDGVDRPEDWRDFPGQFQNQNPISFTGQLLFGADYINFLNRNIRVKMVPACAQDRRSGILTLDYRLSAPHIQYVTRKDVSCNGAADGGMSLMLDRLPLAGESVNINIIDRSNGALRYQELGVPVNPDQTYTWPASKPLTPGFYTAKITSGYNGTDTYNQDAAHSFDFQINEPTLVTFTSPVPANVKCFGGSDGSINLSAGGGAGGYNLLYKGPSDAGYNTVPFAGGTATLSGLGIGDYLIQVKDQNNCPGVAPSGATEVSIPIRQPDAALAIDGFSTTDPKAFGYTDGSITVILKGGTPNADGSYNIEWRSADGTLLSSTGTAGSGTYTTKVSNLPDGLYTISVTDANYSTATGNSNGCMLSSNFPLKQPPLLTAAIQITDSISCNGDSNGKLTAVAGGGKIFGGSVAYNYDWYQVISGTATPIGQTTAVADNLSAGRYLVKVTDANGIERWSDTTDLIDPAPLQMALTATPATCHAGSNGVISAAVSGGTLAYQYSWSNGSQSATNTGLAAGTYTVNLKDYHGCQISDLAIVGQPSAELQIDQPVLTLPLANGYTDGKIKVRLSGGTPLAGGAYNITWQRKDGTVLSTHTEQVVSGGYQSELTDIGAGDYTITVTDANYTGPDPNMKGCTITATFPLNEPPALVVTIARSRYISCKGDADGTLTATASGGVPIVTGPLPYRFQWFRQTASGYIAIGQTTNVASGLMAGTYKVLITDWNNIDKESLPFVLTEPGLLQVQLATEPVSCASGADGAVSATVSGGTAPFKYQWTTGATDSAISKLTEGSYMVFVEDAHGCETQEQADVLIPNGIVVDPTITSPTCTGDCDGAINTLISGGTPPYSYVWSSGATSGSINQLCAGKYTLTIQDANNCKRIQSFNLPDPPQLTINLGADKTLCNAQVWQLSAAIADPAANYAWGGNPAFQASTPQVTLNRSGQYWVKVTDSKGCTAADTISIKQTNAAISAEFVVSTQVFRNEDVTFINISNPSPERVEWVIPGNSGITVVQKTAAVATLRFANTGSYQLGLRAFVGDCQQIFTKNVTVLEQQSFPQPGGAQEPFIKQFDVLPNPNGGQFNVRVALDKQSAIRLRMINIISNELVSDRQESPATQFNIGYQLNVPAGTYLLLLETPVGNAIRKVVIN